VSLVRSNLFVLFAVIAAAGFALTQYLIFFGTRIDIELLYNQKIFYYHVPCWFVLFGATFICGWYSLKFVRKRQGGDDDIAVAAGEIAVLFGLMGLVTGSIWARTAWEAWWVWDARLTTSLILWMTMLGYVLVRKYGGPGSERLSAGLAIFACVNIPLVYVSVKIWNTNHPKTSTVPSLDGMMRLTFWLSVLLFMIVGGLLLAYRIGAARAERRLAETRERGLDAGLLE
jgi:heme exporter protein C